MNKNPAITSAVILLNLLFTRQIIVGQNLGRYREQNDWTKLLPKSNIDTNHQNLMNLFNTGQTGGPSQYQSFGAAPQDIEWQGAWFPHNPNEEDTNTEITLHSLYDAKHGIVMGQPDARCDDGKSNLLVDWNNSPINYTCYEDKSLYRPRSDVHPLESSQHIPAYYNAPHKCLNETISYNELIPTFGTHRPLWAVYGEYTFLPKQRWLHNLEHGAVVMLYHPCANKNEVNFLRKIVSNCLYRHVITPYNLLSKKRPLALVTWGHRLEMSKVAPEVVIDFIKRHALNGPEKTARDGQYDWKLIQKAQVITQVNETSVCDKYANDFIQMK